MNSSRAGLQGKKEIPSRGIPLYFYSGGLSKEADGYAKDSPLKLCGHGQPIRSFSVHRGPGAVHRYLNGATGLSAYGGAGSSVIREGIPHGLRHSPHRGHGAALHLVGCGRKPHRHPIDAYADSALGRLPAAQEGVQCLERICVCIVHLIVKFCIDNHPDALRHRICLDF